MTDPVIEEKKKQRVKTILITKQELDALYEYSQSIPSGELEGKIWKRSVETVNGDPRWQIGAFEKHEQEGKIWLKWYWPIITTIDYRVEKRKRYREQHGCDYTDKPL